MGKVIVVPVTTSMPKQEKVYDLFDMVDAVKEDGSVVQVRRSAGSHTLAQLITVLNDVQAKIDAIKEIEVE